MSLGNKGLFKRISMRPVRLCWPLFGQELRHNQNWPFPAGLSLVSPSCHHSGYNQLSWFLIVQPGICSCSLKVYYGTTVRDGRNEPTNTIPSNRLTALAKKL